MILIVAAKTSKLWTKCGCFNNMLIVSNFLPPGVSRLDSNPLPWDDETSVLPLC
jgi:hypothetical protein